MHLRLDPRSWFATPYTTSIDATVLILNPYPIKASAPTPSAHNAIEEPNKVTDVRSKAIAAVDTRGSGDSSSSSDSSEDSGDDIEVIQPFKRRKI